MRARLDAGAMGFLLVLCAVWGLTPVTIKVANAEIAPLLHAGVRSALSAILLWAWCALRGIRLFERDGSLGYGLLIATLLSAVLLTGFPASSLSAFTFWTPIFGMLAGWLLLAEPVTPALAVSILLIAAGIWTVNQTEGPP